MTGPAAITVFALGMAGWKATQETSQALGLPVWVELAAPFVTGMTAWCGWLIKDWIGIRRRRRNGPDDRELLIQQLVEDIEDARSGEATARRELEAVCRQRDRLQRELDRLRPPE